MTLDIKRVPLIAPKKKGIVKWIFDPCNQEQDATRGTKKHHTIVQLKGCRVDGSSTILDEDISLPYDNTFDGYAVELPTDVTTIAPGEVFGYFEEGYVYHYQWRDEKKRRLARRWRYVCKKYPQVLYGQHMLISGVIAGTTWWAILAQGWTMNGVLVVVALVASTWMLISSSLLTWGSERVGVVVEEFAFKNFFGESIKAKTVRRVVMLCAAAFYSLLAVGWCFDPESSWFSTVLTVPIFVLITLTFAEGALKGSLDKSVIGNSVAAKIKVLVVKVAGWFSGSDDNEPKAT